MNRETRTFIFGLISILIGSIFIGSASNSGFDHFGSWIVTICGFFIIIIGFIKVFKTID